MADTSKKIVVGSMAVSALVALLVLLDLALGFPFNRSYVMDILFLCGAALVLYMGYDTYQELT